MSGASVDKSEQARENERKQIEHYKSLERQVTEKVWPPQCWPAEVLC